MKTPPFLLIGCPVIIVIAGIVYALTYPALRQTSFHAALMDAERPASAADDVDISTRTPQTREQRMQQVFAQLGLSDAQREQIEQIRRTTADRTQRREAIMQVLTPEQRANWQQIRDASHGETPPASSTAAATGGS